MRGNGRSDAIAWIIAARFGSLSISMTTVSTVRKTGSNRDEAIALRRKIAAQISNSAEAKTWMPISACGHGRDAPPSPARRAASAPARLASPAARASRRRRPWRPWPRGPGDFLDAFGDGPTVQRILLERPQDEQVERAGERQQLLGCCARLRKELTTDVGGKVAVDREVEPLDHVANQSGERRPERRLTRRPRLGQPGGFGRPRGRLINHNRTPFRALHFQRAQPGTSVQSADDRDDTLRTVPPHTLGECEKSLSLALAADELGRRDAQRSRLAVTSSSTSRYVGAWWDLTGIEPVTS